MADRSTNQLRRGLRAAGLSKEAINAAWPGWWTDDAASSPSANAELRFALARNLGLSPKSLLGERVEFVWRDQARFKNLSGQNEEQQAALNSFGTVIGRLLIRAVPAHGSLVGSAARDMRMALLARDDKVDLMGLMKVCWGAGIPIIYLRVFPLQTKAMHAMVVGWQGRYAVLLGRDASYPAPIAFTLAHEVGHIALGHLEGASSLVDVEDPATRREQDKEEDEANRFALLALTGSSDPLIKTDRVEFSGAQLAKAVIAAGAHHRIEPGTLALCTGYQTGHWDASMAALRHIYGKPLPMPAEINRLAERLLDWSVLEQEGEDYLRAVMNLGIG